jgi:hypothetical protein
MEMIHKAVFRIGSLGTYADWEIRLNQRVPDHGGVCPHAKPDGRDEHGQQMAIVPRVLVLFAQTEVGDPSPICACLDCIVAGALEFEAAQKTEG